MVYLDTSVLVAYYYPEDSSDAVENFITNMQHPVISRLSELEFFLRSVAKSEKKPYPSKPATRLPAFSAPT